MSILKAALNRENVLRDHKTATAQDRKAERDSVVAAIHKAFLPEVPELEQLFVRGDYNAPIAVADSQAAKVNGTLRAERLQKFGAIYCAASGLELHLGSKISPEHLDLKVEERTDKTPLQVLLRIERRHPYVSATLETFHGHTQPSVMLEKFFEVLTKHVVEEVTV